MAKVRYEVDPHNRLIIAGTGKRSGVPEYRHVAEGSFKVSRNNSLTYHIKKSRHSDIPQQVRFSGNWSLDRNNDLVLTLNKWNNQVAGNKLVIKGRVLDVKGNRLLFSVTTKKPDGRSRISPVANPGLASAGTGDVLAGAIAGLVAQGLSLFDAAALGVYLHGEAGEVVRATQGDTGMIASDLLPVLPAVIKRIKA